MLLYKIYCKIRGKEPNIQESLTFQDALYLLVLGAMAWPLMFTQIAYSAFGLGSSGDILGLVFAIVITVWVNFKRDREWAQKFKKKYSIVCIVVFTLMILYLSVLDHLHSH